MNVLIATDGSEFSFAAVKKCFQLINTKTFTKIKIICVEEKVSVSSVIRLPLDYTKLINKAFRAIAEEIVDQTKQEVFGLIDKTNCLIETQILSGNPKKTIVEEAKKWEADLVVLGSHGRGFWERILLGSVSKAVVKHVGCSVFIGR